MCCASQAASKKRKKTKVEERGLATIPEESSEGPAEDSAAGVTADMEADSCLGDDIAMEQEDAAEEDAKGAAAKAGRSARSKVSSSAEAKSKTQSLSETIYGSKDAEPSTATTTRRTKTRRSSHTPTAQQTSSTPCSESPAAPLRRSSRRKTTLPNN